MWKKKNLSFNNQKGAYFIKEGCWGHANLQGNIPMQAEHSQESSILGLFKLLTTAVLVCNEKTGWDTSHLLCPCAKGWSTHMALAMRPIFFGKQLELSHSRTSPWTEGQMQGQLSKCSAWQLPQAFSNSQYFQFRTFSEELGIQNAVFFSEHRDNHLQPNRKPRAGISWHLQSQKSESTSRLICCPLPAKIHSLKHSAVRT